ncbi:WD40-repeat-containing domain protein [Collybia nuda]|uniref:WD40-repeat-containing domain protein n=1 Tax=Collybia nuda TaxID=64659 RepID=A0A9P5XZ55_9AGAR|nr:WD40-repeat-containing domain protein [Collybia nuda]
MNTFVITDFQYHEGDGYKLNIYAKLSINRNNTESSVMIKDIHEPITFDADLLESVKIMVYTKHRIRRDNFKGVTLDESIGDLCGTEGLVSRKLYKHTEEGGMRELPRSIQFRIQVRSSSSSEEEKEKEGASMTIINEDSQSFDIHDETKRERVSSHTTDLDSDSVEGLEVAKAAFHKIKVAPWQPLLTKVERFNNLMAIIVEVHPYAKLAWSILSAASKFMVDQMDRDENIQRLVSLLDDIFEFLGEASQLETIAELTNHQENQSSDVRLRTQIRILALLSQQVTECAHFICDYAKNTNFWTRTIKHSVSQVDDKILEFQSIFSRLKAHFQDHAVLQIQLSVLQIKFTALSTNNKLDEIAIKVAVNDMLHVTGARYNPDKGCLPNTRIAIIDEIMEWANQPSGDTTGAKIFWLSGVAGSGKSAISHTVAQRFQNMGRLGSSFCFSVSSQAVRGPQHLFSTISWEMANFDYIWRQELAKVIKTNPSISSSHSIMEQFEILLLKPARALQITGPIVIVIDGLDESGDPASRKAILSVLAEKFKELPSNFYFVVTSRPEPDIFKALKPCIHVLSKHMEDISAISTNIDIFEFIQRSVSVENKISLDEKWNEGSWCKHLVDKSEGLFQWASTACLFIESDFYTAVEQLEVLLQPSGNIHNLDSLYTQILDQKTSGGGKTRVDRFVSVMKTVLALKKPLPLTALGKLCFQKELAIVKSVLQPLGALLSGVSSDSAPVQTLHTSLRDYLTDKSRSGCYFIDITEEDKNLTSACLDVMKELHFNMCQLPSSYYRNREIADLLKRVEQNIPPYLAYACIFWTDHLQKSIFQETISTAVLDFLEYKLLFWLEVLSLTRSMDIALDSLKKVISWIGDNPAFSQTVALASDALSFVATFWVVITECAPHIYLSALPFSPQESLVAEQYSGNFKNVLSLQVGKKALWPEGQSVLAGHQGHVNSVSFSIDGKYLASGSGDKSIWIWNAITHKAVLGPILGHTEGITSIIFTYDGQYIASGSQDKTIRLLDAQTGALRAKPFEGHKDYITCMASSPNGPYIVSGSNDKTIRLWDIRTGDSKVIERCHINPIRSIAFSSDGKYIASGAEDVKIWDSITGLEIKMAWESNFDMHIRSLAFSPDGLFIAAGTGDGTIKVWNIESGHGGVNKLIEGHIGSILSVAFSCDGKYIVSGSVDMTVRVWNTLTGEAVGDPLQGHTNAVTSVVFLPDGKSIASGSKDKTIRMWDLETDTGIKKHSSTTIKKHSDGHAHVVQSVAISSDGKNIVSGSYDKTIRLWDVETGIAVKDAFKGHTSRVKSVAFSPDGNYVVSGSNDNTVRLWSTATGLPVGTAYEGHNNYVNSVAFSPLGKYVASGSNDHSLRIWDVETGTMAVGPMLGHTKGVRCIAFSPNGKFIASGSDDMCIRLWDTETGKSIGGVLEGHMSWLNSIAFSYDGKYIASASADQTVRLWDVETCKQIGIPMRGHRKWVTSVTFSPTGKHIFSGSDDGTLRIWDTHTLKIVGDPLWGHASRVTSVAISSDGQYLVSGSADQTIRVWDLKLVLLSLNTYSPLPQTSGPSPFNKKFKIMDGWVVGPGTRLLFWLPLWNRDIPFYPKNPVVITQNPTILDYTRFVHGEQWVNCKTRVQDLAV